jgi:hypothetical protein
VKPAQNHTQATIWIALGFAVASAAILVLFGKVPFLAPALLMLSALMFMLGAQRTERFAVESIKFKKRIQLVAFATAILGSLSIIFNSVLQ